MFEFYTTHFIFKFSKVGLSRGRKL